MAVSTPISRAARALTFAFAFALLLLPASVQGQSGGAPAAKEPADPSWRLEQCMGGLTYGAPLKWALAYGGGWVREGDGADVCLLGTVKVGIGGASVNMGVAHALGPFGSGTSLTVGLLRTFNRPLDATPSRSYVGASLHIWPILGLGGEVGLYTRLGDDPAGLGTARRLLVWSTGFGF